MIKTKLAIKIAVIAVGISIILSAITLIATLQILPSPLTEIIVAIILGIAGFFVIWKSSAIKTS